MQQAKKDLTQEVAVISLSSCTLRPGDICVIAMETLVARGWLDGVPPNLLGKGGGPAAGLLEIVFDSCVSQPVFPQLIVAGVLLGGLGITAEILQHVYTLSKLLPAHDGVPVKVMKGEPRLQLVLSWLPSKEFPQHVPKCCPKDIVFPIYVEGAGYLAVPKQVLVEN
eukprot:CAMPEP_0202355252 /NCGR_PEP_ID=MMETSP1126-20121109/10230_1 /ASSEMBLY_ACC=CAM_ASM_000457 /TAXON_ID=3047 /ORGANISM="Dunaliella tertiolecta, Strain CCMP1320" /LENGTH=166 /DNA_ID=CAMNT_0048947849 /DNA_START=476 /DNA_END=976 /DNA_ORIENTATION=-